MDMEKSAAAPLLEDVLLEILARVTDPIALFRCATVCRQWRALVIDPTFLNRRWPENAPDRSFLLGFIVVQSPNRLFFLPAPPSQHGPPRRFLGSHFPVLLDGGGFFPGHVMVPLTSRHGLLLVHFRPQGFSFSPADPEPKIVKLAVYNMFSGAYTVLPPLECHGFSDIVCSAVLTSADCRRDPQYSAFFFKVIIIGTGEKLYNLYSFSSSEASWSAPIECRNIPKRLSAYKITMPCGTVVCQGRPHWLFRDTSHLYTLSVSLDTHQVSFVQLPTSISLQNMFGSLQLCAGTDGTLTLLAMCGRRLEIWTKENNEPQTLHDDTRWLWTQVINTLVPSQICPVRWMYMGETIGASLLLGSQWCTYTIDLETRTLEEKTGQFRFLAHGSSAPFEMDCPTFFTSRLNNHMDFV
jgi:hypothetical protein